MCFKQQTCIIGLKQCEHIILYTQHTYPMCIIIIIIQTCLTTNGVWAWPARNFTLPCSVSLQYITFFTLNSNHRTKNCGYNLDEPFFRYWNGTTVEHWEWEHVQVCASLVIHIFTEEITLRIWSSGVLGFSRCVSIYKSDCKEAGTEHNYQHSTCHLETSRPWPQQAKHSKDAKKEPEGL